MPTPISSLRGIFRGLLAASLVTLAVLITSPEATGFDEALPPRVLMTCLGVAVGSFLAFVLVAAWNRVPKLVMFGFVSLATSQVCFYLLWWTSLTQQPTLWRVWWVALVVAATVALRAPLVRPEKKPDWLWRATGVCTSLTGLLLAGLAADPSVPPDPSPLYLLAIVIPAMGAVLGFLALWARQAKLPKPSSPWAKMYWQTLLLFVVFFAGIYFGRASAPTAGQYELLPSTLAHLNSDEIDRQVNEDSQRLRKVTAAIEDLRTTAAALHSELGGRLTAENRDYYTPEEEDQIRWLYVSYLAQRAALVRMVTLYSGFESVRDPQLKARSFVVGLAAATTLYETSLRLIDTYGDQPRLRRKLNEPEPNWGLVAGIFDQIHDNVADHHNLSKCEELAHYFEEKAPEWRSAEVWPKKDFDWIEGRIVDAVEYVRSHQAGQDRSSLARLRERVRSDAYKPVYAVQSLVSEWIGDAKIVNRPPFIRVTQIEEMEKMLEPGDILLERRNWYLSNAFLPGFWPHAALYIGQEEDLTRLEILDEPAVQLRLSEWRKTDAHGRPNTVIEAVSEGVIFNSLEHSMHADYVAVLRPRLPKQRIAEAIVRVFRHQGKPYDFEFDFFSSDKLVCTEVVYRSYEGLIHFPLIKVMGRDTLPAIEIARKFAAERNQESPELDFVAFLDAVPEKGTARFADISEFIASADRPGAFSE